jgi:hypothetical protein
MVSSVATMETKVNTCMKVMMLDTMGIPVEQGTNHIDNPTVMSSVATMAVQICVCSVVTMETEMDTCTKVMMLETMGIQMVAKQITNQMDGNWVPMVSSVVRSVVTMETEMDTCTKVMMLETMGIQMVANEMDGKWVPMMMETMMVLTNMECAIM